MQKNYLPPSSRKGRFNLSLKVFWVVLVFLAFFVLVNLYFSLTIGKVGAQKATLITADAKTIKDNVTSKEFKGTPQVAAKVVSVASIPVILKTLPLDYGWPLRGRITTYYSAYHPAIDIAASMGTPIHPFASGVVTSIVRGGNLGNHLVIAHTNGYETMYAHLSVVNVVVGEQVDPSMVIGEVGSTGNSTGPHLHFQVSEDGKTFDPLKILH